MVRFFVNVKSRRARARARKGVVLADMGITKQTQVRYFTAVGRIIDRLNRCHTFQQMDEVLSNWINHCFEKGEPVNTVADCLSGIHYYLPMTRRHLPEAWKLYSIWKKYEIPSRAAPLTADITMAWASRAIQQGNISLGCLILLGFHCLLRTGEILQVKPRDILISPKTGIVRLTSSKGGLRNNMVESVTIEDPVVRLVLAEVLAYKAARGLMNVPIWNKSGSSFRQAFFRLLQYFQLTHLHFRPYSLRRGGATAYFQQCGLMEKTLIRGRWASVAAAKIYIADALSQIPELKCTPECKAKIDAYITFFR